MTSTRTPRILVLAQYYRPEPNFISADVALALSREGRVTVVTAHPNYPLGRFYDGVRGWLPRRTEEDGMTVWRLPIIPYHGNSKLGRLVCYLSFALAASLFAPFVAGRPALVWVYNTPFTASLPALWFRYVLRAKLVFTCADLWPESFTAAGVVRPGRLIRLLRAYRRAMNRAADLIVCSTRSTAAVFEAEGIPRERLPYVPVWVDGMEAGEPLLDRAQGDGAEPAIVYAGNLGPAQGLDTVVRAAARLRAEGVRVRFDLYGTGAAEAELRALAAELGAENVRFPGRVTPDGAFRACTNAAGQIVSLRSTPLFRMTVPSKLAFSFAAAAPVLYGLEGESAEIAANSGGAVAFTPGDDAGLAEAVRGLLARPETERVPIRRRLRAYYEENFARGMLIRRYEELLGAELRARRVRGAAAEPIARPSPAATRPSARA